MKQDFEKVMETAGYVVDKAAHQAALAAQSGRGHVELYQLKRRLAKSQKQLGALVYMLNKTGQDSEPMVEHYINEIDDLKAKIELHEARKAVEKTFLQCTMCGAKSAQRTLFCRRCGAKMPK